MTGSDAAATPRDPFDDPAPLGLDSPLRLVLAAGPATVLAKAFGMATVGDLLSHYPRRYARRGELTTLAELPLDEAVTVLAEVISVTVQDYGRAQPGKKALHRTKVVISDGHGMLPLTFFNKPWLIKTLRPGMRGMFSGKVTIFNKARQLAQPDYQIVPGSDDPMDATISPADAAEARLWGQRPIPIYPATAAMTSWQIAKIIVDVLGQLGPVDDPIPEQMRLERSLLGHRDALTLIHRPVTDEEWNAARATLRFTEAFVLQCVLVQQHTEHRALRTRSRQPVPGGYLERFDRTLPFALTVDQEITGAEILRDIALTAPMNRLVQGEVGSGKTVVALRAMLAVADSGGQAALLAPTEVLAGQHLRSIARILGPDLTAELMPTLLTGQLPVAERRKALLRTVSGQARIVIGTHALLSDTVGFFDLGLVVIDEQHRFGVDQREALRQKAELPPHVLVLTATPIPRTIAMTVFGDLDVSTIAMLPSGRPGIESFVVPLDEKPAWVVRVWQRVSEELALGRQCFVVCPAIAPKKLEQGEEIDFDATPMTTVEELNAELHRHPLLRDARIEPLHGAMTADEKDETMRAFAAGDIQVLVATTVIEVGVDVPNASVMVVMDAHRFGVSQLHQLRGRVGRGGVPGLCLLVTAAPTGSPARDRIEAVANTLDGFVLAQVDLEQRQEGDVLGRFQSGGQSSLRLLRVATDGDIIADARTAARELIGGDPEMRTMPALRAAVRRRLDDSERAALSKG
ncbi:ATP-dependent DNA helicase RecG [Cryobacterium sp. MP_3.1]|uniref:Probable DNA 3'-5' helicase RecG n=1 Tax=Cryobacterium zongtaii TaxID=1259217 RepID=A0A2S3Z8W3_9MICO|nr:MULTISPECIES: ATP-dependent DNA helicase RecG [Cryobacterium]MEC5184590.1 ATP-dependent DNA helicase RecG [Cryobacterium sp. MP_3.1]POH61981.1 ATP-dependent DNA helicase RecG [Cryobacterium zongtaii]